MATLSKWFLKPDRGSNSRPLAASHSLIVQSRHAAARRLLSGLKARHQTVVFSTEKERNSFPVDNSQSLTSLLPLEYSAGAASNRPLGLTAKLVTSSSTFSARTSLPVATSESSIL